MRGPPGTILAGSAPSTLSGPTRKSKPSSSAVCAKSRMGVGPVPISVTGMFTPSCMVFIPYSLALLCGGRLGRLQVGRISEMDRRVRFERALEVEALGDRADRRENFRAHQLDAGERIGLTDAAVIAPQSQDAGPRLLEDALELRDHRLGRAGDDAQVGHLLFEAGLAARILRPPGGELDESAARGW